MQSREGMRKGPRSTMKINPYSSNYPSSPSNRGNARGAAAGTGADATSGVKNQSSIQPANNNSDNSRQQGANGVENAYQLSQDVDYYSAKRHRGADFYVAESKTAAADYEAVSGNFKRVNNQLTARALDTYRTHQEMDDEQALRQAHQIALGVDTYA